MRIGNSVYLLRFAGLDLCFSSVSNAVLIFSLVLQIPCFCLFMRPLSFAGAESGKYFWTYRDVNPGHV